MKQEKPVFLIGAGKGRLIPVLEKFLESINLKNPNIGRKLVYDIETEKYILRIALLRWEDIKKNYDKFDLVIYGADQWLESGHKSMIALKFYPQESCRISLLVPNSLLDKSPAQYISEKRIATSYPNLAREYLGASKDKIITISGSVEAAVLLGWADCILDVVETGTTAKENGLYEAKTYVKFGAILATSRPEKIPLLINYGIIKSDPEALTIAFDGNDGSGKSTISKFLVQNGLWSERPTVLVTPFSGKIGLSALSLFESKKYLDWATVIGKNHWRAPKGVTAVYDRSILTVLTDLIDNDFSDSEIKQILESWKPLPKILFYCDVKPELSYKRVGSRGIDDSFSTLKELKKYYELYNRAVEYLEKEKIVKVKRLDTSLSFTETIEIVKQTLIENQLIDMRGDNYEK